MNNKLFSTQYYYIHISLTVILVFAE